MAGEGLVQLGARSQDEAEMVIFTLLRECAEGKGDREADALMLANEWSVDPKWVRDSFVVARKRWSAVQAGEVFILPAAQPKHETGASLIAEDVRPKQDRPRIERLKIRRVPQLAQAQARLPRPQRVVREAS